MSFDKERETNIQELVGAKGITEVVQKKRKQRKDLGQRSGKPYYISPTLKMLVEKLAKSRDPRRKIQIKKREVCRETVENSVWHLGRQRSFKKGLVNSGNHSKSESCIGFGNMEGIPMILPILKSSMLIFFKLSLLLAVVVVMIVSVIGWGKQE